MSKLTVQIYTDGKQLPTGLTEEDTFHSSRLFRLFKETPRHKPYMVTVEDAGGHVLSQLLAIVRYRSSWFPPYLYRQCRIVGAGSYQADTSQTASDLFGMMLQAITERLGRSVLFIEVSNLPQKMFGYRQFRENSYFPVRWMSIHNSLHSHTPEERISEQLQRRIKSIYGKGVITSEVENDDDFKAFMKLLRHHNWLKPKRYIPADEFFHGLRNSCDSRLFLTRYRDHVIGCSAVIYSQRQAYLWYAAFRRKTYAWLHPHTMTIWHVLKDSHKRGFEHVFFMDVGLPFRKNAFRDFILRFGGKPTSTYRWFHCPIGWINSLLSWFYRD
ncbi:MAG: GNAT family N-acetyltransferase [Prevotella sp.]|nr:GNAT family N-acetyltransferase [Prevotella sp.]